MNKVYPISSDGYKAIDRIDELLQEPSTLLIDVRLNAWSWRVDFRSDGLEAAYGARYRRAGRYLGNTAMYGTWLVRIASPVVGIQGLARYLSEGHDLVLLYQDEEHIKEICRLLTEVRPGVEIVEFKSELPGVKRDGSTKVVHCKKEPYDVYIGRGRGSIWGNPFVIGKDGTRDEVIAKYREYILGRPELLAQLESLRGKTLACWCSPMRCHGDVLVELLEQPVIQSPAS